MIEISREARRLSRYGVVGLVNNACLYIMYLILVWLEILPQLALALVYSLGVSISFVWNRRWTFESTAGHRSDLVKFLLAYGIGLLGSVCALSVLLIWFSPEVAQLFNIGATALMIYSLLRVFRFGG